jgi:hypothetical protein
MNLVILALVFVSGLVVGSWFSRRRAQESSYDLGYEAGVKRGFEQVPTSMKQILGQRRFQEITREIRKAVDET